MDGEPVAWCSVAPRAEFVYLRNARTLKPIDAELSLFYAGLVESEGNHYATYLLMARAIDDAETDRRLDFYLDLDATLIREPNPRPMLH